MGININFEIREYKGTFQTIFHPSSPLPFPYSPPFPPSSLPTPLPFSLHPSIAPPYIIIISLLQSKLASLSPIFPVFHIWMIDWKNDLVFHQQNVFYISTFDKNNFFNDLANKYKFIIASCSRKESWIYKKESKNSLQSSLERCSVVGDYINIMKMTFDLIFDLYTKKTNKKLLFNCL